MGLGLPNPYTPKLESTFKKQPTYRICLFLPTYLDIPQAIPFLHLTLPHHAAYPVPRVRGALKSLNRREPRNFAAAVAVTLHHPERSPLNTTHPRHQYQCLLRSTGDIGSNHTSTACPRDRPRLLTPLNHARDSNPCASWPTPEAVLHRQLWAVNEHSAGTPQHHATVETTTTATTTFQELIIDHEQPKGTDISTDLKRNCHQGHLPQLEPAKDPYDQPFLMRQSHILSIKLPSHLHSD
ncbi:hypothetical protein CSIM01_03556 [Colletotrichum simmondsii]|uniref:Uncharacterized protein n=1 Tax=Colletotrichum simmondsii TaxID=703756 RepID=A0A135RZ09_9PEZI|nr:hypothetical protein CSIM01_03556 [Colletotrichum simmondsii]